MAGARDGPPIGMGVAFARAREDVTTPHGVHIAPERYVQTASALLLDRGTTRATRGWPPPTNRTNFPSRVSFTAMTVLYFFTTTTTTGADAGLLATSLSRARVPRSAPAPSPVSTPVASRTSPPTPCSIRSTVSSPPRRQTSPWRVVVAASSPVRACPPPPPSAASHSSNRPTTSRPSPTEPIATKATNGTPSAMNLAPAFRDMRRRRPPTVGVVGSVERQTTNE